MNVGINCRQAACKLCTLDWGTVLITENYTVSIGSFSGQPCSLSRGSQYWLASARFRSVMIGYFIQNWNPYIYPINLPKFYICLHLSDKGWEKFLNPHWHSADFFPPVLWPLSKMLKSALSQCGFFSACGWRLSKIFKSALWQCGFFFTCPMAPIKNF